ncbi:LysR family transcriptional regulator [Burkholderia anthina]|uniref:LysR family transcriptional regulator n=1 Tax=Burkholderia anthina TaxID=179879 RepID=UPI000751E7D9|nr:LysR family transcriptional regulator [Burkholderia anthina]KVN53119.1 transcriptional regulator [Burkholderia anthina]
MDASDLRLFEAVARNGSMNRAAMELHTVQSNVTARIRVLEEELSVALFQRHNRGVDLTPAGHRLLPFATRMARLLDDARAAAKDDGEPAGALTIGTLETTAALRLPGVLAEFALKYPAVRLVVQTGITTTLLQDVVEYRLDGAFVSGPVDHPDLESEAIFPEEMVLVTSRTIDSIAKLRAVSELKIVVFRSGCSFRRRLEGVLAAHGIVATMPLEFGSLDAIIGCVAAGVGVTLLPKSIVADAWQRGRVSVHELPPAIARVDTMFIRRKDVYATSAMAAFRDMVRPAALKDLTLEPSNAA